VRYRPCRRGRPDHQNRSLAQHLSRDCGVQTPTAVCARNRYRALASAGDDEAVEFGNDLCGENKCHACVPWRVFGRTISRRVFNHAALMLVRGVQGTGGSGPSSELRAAAARTGAQQQDKRSERQTAWSGVAYGKTACRIRSTPSRSHAGVGKDRDSSMARSVSIQKTATKLTRQDTGL